MADKKMDLIITADDQASSVLQGIGNNVKSLNDNIQTVGKGFVAIGAASAAGLGISLKSAIDFESAFAGIRKTVDASDAEFSQLEKNIRAIAKASPTSATELSKIGETAGQLGVRGVDNLTKFIDTISKISVSTNLTADNAATSFARIANIMQEPIGNVDKMGSAVVELGNNFATTETDVVNFATRIAGAGKIAGLSTADIFGIGAAMSSVGVEAEAGGTAVQKVLLSMKQATVSGNGDLEVFAKTAGMTGAQFKKAFETDAGGAFEKFVTGLGGQGDKALGTLSDLGLEDQRLIRSFLSLANAGDLVTNAMGRSDSAFQANTALSTEAGKRYATTESQLAMFKNSLTDIAITIGSAVLPALNNLLNAVRPAVEAFAQFATQHPILIAGLLAVGAAIGVIGLAMLAIGPIVAFVTALFSLIGVAAAGLGIALGLILSPIGLIILAIVALIAVGYLIYTHWTELSALALQVWTTIVTTITTALIQIQTFFITIWTMIQEWFIAFWDNLTNNILFQILTNLALMIYNILMLILGFFQLVWTTIQVVIQTILYVILAIVQAVMTAIQSVITAVMNAVNAFITAIWNTIKAFITGILAQILAVVTTGFTAIQTFVQQIMEKVRAFIQQKMQEAANHISEGVNAMKGFFNSLMGAIDAVISKFNAMAEAASRALSAARDAIAGAGNKIKGALGFQHGGVIPGAYNQEVPAILHGGERIVSRTGTDVNGTTGGGGGGSPVNIIIEGDVNSMETLNKIIEAVKEAMGRDNELVQQGVSV